MTRINQSDQILLLVTEHLRRSARSKKEAPGKSSSTRTSTGRPLDRVRALTAFQALPKPEARQWVIRGVLTERFGDHVVNDPAFQQLTQDVSRLLDTTEEGRALVERALQELGAS